MRRTDFPLAGAGCRPVFSAVALLALFFPAVHAQTFDWSEVPPIHPGVQHALIATNVIPALPQNNQWRHINVLRIDLSEPSLRFHTTPRAALWGEPMPDDPVDGSTHPGYFVRTERQSNWNFIQQARAGGTNMVASINAAPWTPWNPSHELYADRLGLTVSAGVLVSEANNLPSLVFDRNWTGRLQDSPAGVDISEVELAVSGFEYVLSSGTVIATGTTPQPRTGYGISQDGRYLYWMTVDGRINLVIAGASRYLSGASHQEVGLLLQYLGAWDGLNMDGGYSTQMTTWDGGSGQLVQRAMTAGTNVTQHRRVANNLGLYLDTRPPVPSVTPVSLHRALPRGAAETATLEVRNTGGGALDCTVSSDVPWVEVPGESFSVKGRHLLDVRIDSDGLPPGTHSARITVRHGGQPAEESVVTLTLDVPSTPRLPEDLPLVESFESLPEGHWLPGTAGWIGNYTAAQVRGEIYSAVEPPGPPLPLASRTRVARLTCGVTRRVLASEGQPIKVDLMKQFASRGLTVAEEMSPEWQAAFGVDHAGVLHLWHRDHDGNGWVPRWTALGQPALAADEWVRLSVDFDYTTSPHGDAFFRPRINGSMVPTARGFRAPDDLRSPGPWYMTANSPGQGRGNGPRRLAALDFAGRGAVDDVVVRDAAEATGIYPEWMGFAHRGAVQRDGVPLAWFDRWGLRRDPAAPVAGYDRTARQAFLTGTDPLDPDGKFRVLRHWMSDGRFHVEIMGNDSGAAAPYIMRGTTNLADGVWEDVWEVPRAAAPANTTIWSHEMPTDRSSYFYRIEAVEEGTP